MANSENIQGIYDSTRWTPEAYTIWDISIHLPRGQLPDTIEESAKIDQQLDDLLPKLDQFLRDLLPKGWAFVLTD